MLGLDEVVLLLLGGLELLGGLAVLGGVAGGAGAGRLPWEARADAARQPASVRTTP
jgi:hypothetical protein